MKESAAQPALLSPPIVTDRLPMKNRKQGKHCFEQDELDKNCFCFETLILGPTPPKKSRKTQNPMLSRMSHCTWANPLNTTTTTNNNNNSSNNNAVVCSFSAVSLRATQVPRKRLKFCRSRSR